MERAGYATRRLCSQCYCCRLHSRSPAVRQLSAERLAAGVLAGLHGLRSYTVAAEALAVEMAQEQEGVEAAAAIVEAAALA